MSAPQQPWDLDSGRSLTASPSGPTLGASLGVPTVGSEHRGALSTNNRADVARRWCDLRLAEIPVDGAMARDAESQQVVELVGIKVRVETPEGPHVVDLESVRGSASLAGVPVTIAGCLSGLSPVRSSVVNPPAAICSAVLTTTMSRTPSAVALEAAEVVGPEGARVSGDRLAARLTLKLDNPIAHARLIAPIALASVEGLSHVFKSTKSGRSTNPATRITAQLVEQGQQ